MKNESAVGIKSQSCHLRKSGSNVGIKSQLCHLMTSNSTVIPRASSSIYKNHTLQKKFLVQAN